MRVQRKLHNNNKNVYDVFRAYNKDKYALISRKYAKLN